MARRRSFAAACPEVGPAVKPSTATRMDSSPGGCDRLRRASCMRDRWTWLGACFCRLTRAVCSSFRASLVAMGSEGEAVVDSARRVIDGHDAGFCRVRAAGLDREQKRQTLVDRVLAVPLARLRPAPATKRRFNRGAMAQWHTPLLYCLSSRTVSDAVSSFTRGSFAGPT